MGKRSDPLGGVKCFSVGGRLVDLRQRCLGMTDEERQWRAQFLKDQVLTEEEPRFVPEYYKATTNIFRRLYKTPMRAFKKILEPTLGTNGAIFVRHLIGKGTFTLCLIYLGTYYAMYTSNDFTYWRTLEIFKSRGRMFPNEPDYPNFPVKEPKDYYDQGFYSSILCQEVEREPEPPPEPETVILPEGVICPGLEEKPDN